MIDSNNKTTGPVNNGARFVDTYLGVCYSMIKITQKIRAAYEVRPIDPNRWPPASRSNAARMAEEVTRQWHQRQQASAALCMNRQRRRD